MKGLLLNNIKYINPEIMKKSSLDRKKTIKNNKILFILKRRNTNKFNFVGFEDKKDTKKIKKNFSFFPENDSLLNKSSKNNFHKIDKQSKKIIKDNLKSINIFRNDKISYIR